MELPSISSNLYDYFREMIRRWGVQIPILVDNATGEIIDGRIRKRIADEHGIRDIPTIFVNVLTLEQQDELRVMINTCRRHLTRGQIRQFVAWEIQQNPGESDRCVAQRMGVSHPTVARIRRELEAGPGVNPRVNLTVFDEIGRLYGRLSDLRGSVCMIHPPGNRPLREARGTRGPAGVPAAVRPGVADRAPRLPRAEPGSGRLLRPIERLESRPAVP
jgi:hypothetical protein